MNAKQEFLGHTEGKDILCAELSNNDDYYRDDRERIVLPVGYTATMLDSFLALLDIEYDAGYGGQRLYGTIWYKDGTWSDRGEYDGSEWWVYQKAPDLPDSVKSGFLPEKGK